MGSVVGRMKKFMETLLKKNLTNFQSDTQNILKESIQHFSVIFCVISRNI